MIRDIILTEAYRACLDKIPAPTVGCNVDITPLGWGILIGMTILFWILVEIGILVTRREFIFAGDIIYSEEMFLVLNVVWLLLCVLVASMILIILSFKFEQQLQAMKTAGAVLVGVGGGVGLIIGIIKIKKKLYQWRF